MEYAFMCCKCRKLGKQDVGKMGIKLAQIQF